MNCFVKESYGVIWHFYHNTHGICYCKMTDENITEYQVLLPDGQEDFDILVDDSDCIHLVFQNSDGDIMYANHFNGQWRKTTLLQSKNQSYYPKDFVLKRVNNWLNLMYCIEYNGRRMLTHHIIDNTEGTPLVVDCIKNDYCIAQDSSCNIIALFYSETQKSWGIRKYVWSKKEWSAFSAISVLEGCQNPFLYIDSDDNIHIVYEREMCIMEYFDKNEKMLGTGQKPVMLYQNEDVVIWEGIADNKVYVKRSRDNAPTVIMSGGFSRPARFKLRYTTYESDFRADYCTGNIINGSVRVYGINNFFIVSQTSPVSFNNQKNDESNDATHLEIQKLKIKISQLNGIIERLQSQIEEYDIKKLDRRLNELETAVNKSNKPKLFSFF